MWELPLDESRHIVNVLPASDGKEEGSDSDEDEKGKRVAGMKLGGVLYILVIARFAFWLSMRWEREPRTNY